MKRLFILCCLVGLSLGSKSQTALTDRLPLDPAIQTGKLSNGLTYYIRKNAKPEKKVELRLVINAGSLQEDETQLGLAHFCEHMAFNGTKNFPKNELVSFLEKMGIRFGADLNAYTSFNETVYMLPVPLDNPENLEKGFQVIEDWAHNCTYDPAEITKERGVVLEESRIGKGAWDRMFKQYRNQLFAGSKYAQRLPIGKDEIIQNAKPETIKRFYTTWYRPNLMAVIVVGDLEPSAALAMIKKHFGAITNPKTIVPHTETALPARTKTEVKVVTDKEATNYSLQVYFDNVKSPDASTLGAYQKGILQRLLTSMMSARFRELGQSANPPFLGAGAFNGGMARGYDNFTLSCGISKAGIDTALTATLGVVEQARKFGFLSAELERAKTSMLSSMERAAKEKDKTESSSFVQEYISLFLQNEPSPGIDQELKYYKDYLPKVTLQDVNSLLNSFKMEGHKFILLTGPENGEHKLPTEAELLAMYTKASKQTVKAYEEKALASSLMASAPTGGKIVSESVNLALGITEMTLNNGVKVTLKTTDFKNDEIQMRATRFGGINNYPVQDLRNASLISGIIGEMGLASFPPSDIRKINAGKIANVRPNIGNLTSGFQGSSSVKDFETLLQMVFLNATAPRRDDNLFAGYKGKQKSQWAMMGANPQFAFYDTLGKWMSNNSVWELGLPKPADYDQINLERAISIYKECIGDAAGMHFVFVGSLDEAKMKPLIAQYLGSLPSSGKEKNWVDNGSRSIKGIQELKFYKGADPKSMVQMAWEAETKYSPDFEFHADALSEILNIRVIEKMREEMSGIYGGGFYCSVSKRPYEHFSAGLSFPCGPENVDKLIAAALAEIENIKTNGPKEEDLAKIKQQWTEQHRESVKDNGYWLGELHSIQLFKADPDRVLNYDKYLAALTVKDVQEAAKVIFGGPNRATAVMYPEKK
jgi:zinc protease